MTALTPEARQRLRALHDAATPGEWRYVEGDNLFVASERGLIFDIQPRSHGVDVPVHQRSANGRYVAELHNALPALLAALDRRAEGETPDDPNFYAGSPKGDPVTLYKPDADLRAKVQALLAKVESDLAMSQVTGAYEATDTLHDLIESPEFQSVKAALVTPTPEGGQT